MRTRYSHVAVIGVDGMGNYNLKTETPNFDRIFGGGAVTYHALSMSPTISAQNWCAMLLGASPEVHRYTNSSLGRFLHNDPALPSLFRRIRTALPDAAIVSCSEWAALNVTLASDADDGIEVYSIRDGSAIMEVIEKKIAEKPTLLFTQFEEPDAAGHATEYGSEEHLAAIRLNDSYAGRIYDAYVRAGIADDTLFLAITDHGGIRNGHGGYTDVEKYIYLAAAGRDVPKGEIGPAFTRDLSAIVLYALGIDVPPYDEDGFSSQVPDGIFPEVHGSYHRIQPKTVELVRRDTPDLHAEDGLYRFVDEERVRLAMFCDYNLEDATGKNRVEPHNLPKYYSEGICGARAELGRTGYAVFPEFRIGGGSFTAAVWLKIDRTLDEGVVVFANKNWFWRDRTSRGVGLSFRANDTVFSIGTGEDQEEYMAALPQDTADDGWVHVTAVVDKEAAEYRLYYNFRRAIVLDIEDCYLDIGDSDMPFTVGNDGLGTFSNEKYDLIVNMDDFMIIDGAMTEDEIRRLGEYYKI